MSIDVDDVSGCPLAEQCESCQTTHDLGVVTLGTPIGVYCLTVCGTCVQAARFPRSWVSTAELVLRHCRHLGIDLDQMAEAMQAEAVRAEDQR